jgi:hypothetical protein
LAASWGFFFFMIYRAGNIAKLQELLRTRNLISPRFIFWTVSFLLSLLLP